MLARAGMLICPNGRPLLGSLVSYFYSWLGGVVPELPEGEKSTSVDLFDVLKQMYSAPLRPLSNGANKRLPFGPRISLRRIIEGAL
jgi:hypothetical protein